MSADLHHPIAGKAARQRFILKTAWFMVPATYAILGVAYAVVPPLPGMEEPGARLVLAVRWLLVAMIPYATVCLVIAAVRLFEGSHNPLLGHESERLQIHCRVMQNTLEQLVWLALCVLPLATLLAPAQARLIPIVCTLFAAARLLYWWGYLRSATLGRAPGVQSTFALNILLFVLTMLLFGRHLVSA